MSEGWGGVEGRKERGAVVYGKRALSLSGNFSAYMRCDIIDFHEDISRDIIGCFHECGRKRDAGLK